MMNPYFILGAVIVWAASVAGAFFYGQGVGKDSEIATQAREDKVAILASEAAASAAAKAISKLEVKHAVIRQKADTIIREVPVYRDCLNDDRVLDAINQARGYEPAGSGVVPSAPKDR
jgi:hypothetical protein